MKKKTFWTMFNLALLWGNIIGASMFYDPNSNALATELGVDPLSFNTGGVIVLCIAAIYIGFAWFKAHRFEQDAHHDIEVLLTYNKGVIDRNQRLTTQLHKFYNEIQSLKLQNAHLQAQLPAKGVNFSGVCDVRGLC